MPEPEGEVTKPPKESPAVVEKQTTSATEAAAPAPKDWHAWVKTINYLFQIAAIIVVGFWTWKVFLQTVAPGLEAKFPVDTELHWAAVPGNDVCEARFEVTVKNEGQVPFDIDKVLVNGWLVDLEKWQLLPKDALKPAHLNPAITNDETPGHVEAFDTGNGDPINADIRDHYPPGAHSTSSAQFFFKRRPKTIAVMLATVSGTRPSSLLPFAGRKPLENYSYAIDQVCGAEWDKPMPPTRAEAFKPKSKRGE